jgi:protein-disulfide isomerase-like protein with CxxC motif
MRAGLTVTEYTDPLCPWAWGSQPVLHRLRRALGPGVRWRTVFGILFDTDDDEPPDERAETAWYHRHLRDIAATTGAPWPETLERVARSSWPSAIVATAARAQGEAVAARVLCRLREEMFLRGTPPDTLERALAAATAGGASRSAATTAGVSRSDATIVFGVDEARLRQDAHDPRTRDTVARDYAETRRPRPEAFAPAAGFGSAGSAPAGSAPAGSAPAGSAPAGGVHNGHPKPTNTGYRYALPTLVFDGRYGSMIVAGWHEYREYIDGARSVLEP